jgi:phage tail-like protein
MSVGRRINDPFSAFLFRVEIRGIVEGFFRECSGLESTIQVVEDPQVGRGQMGKLPGRVVYANITLRQGLTQSLALYQWHLAAIQGNVQRVNGSVLQVGPDGARQLARWNFTNGWPSKYTGPSFNSSNNELSVETFEIAHEGLERVM